MFKYYHKETIDCFVLMLSNMSLIQIARERNYTKDMFDKIYKNIKYINKQKDKKSYFNKLLEESK